MQKGYLQANLFNSCTLDSSGSGANGSCIISVLCLYGLRLKAAIEGWEESIGKVAKEFDFMNNSFLVSYWWWFGSV
jgi:hypothetical protein